MSIDKGSVSFEFTKAICATFGLGSAADALISPLGGNANRLWRLDVPAGQFVVKEFRYTVEDAAWVEAVRRAAEFEYTVWATGTILMPQPVRTVDGALVPIRISMSGRPALVRMHRWFDGEEVSIPYDVALAARAGAQLALIQDLGTAFHRQRSGILRWPLWEPAAVLDRLRRSGLIESKTAQDGRSLLREVELLVRHGETTTGAWVYCHYDHKPGNIRLVGDMLGVLDWDESAACHPRLEAVESAMRWAGFESGVLAVDLFGTFLDAYRVAGGQADRLRPADFAKCAAGILSWIDCQGRRALKESADDVDEEVVGAVGEVRSSLDALRRLSAGIPSWCTAAFL